jgi:ketosteroid isomerase-like protein
MADNVRTIAAIYEALGRGDVPAILERMADDVEWEPGIRETTIP